MFLQAITIIITFIFITSAATAAEVRFGYTADLSSNNKVYSNAFGMGLDAYLQYINQKNGIHEQPVSLLAIDNAGDLKLLNDSLKTLTEENLQAIIVNPIPIPDSRALINNFAFNNKIVILGKNFDDNHARSKYYVGYTVNYSKEVVSILEYMQINKKALYNEIVIYVDQSPLAKSCSKTAVDHLKSFGASDRTVRIVNNKHTLSTLDPGNTKGVLLCADLEHSTELFTKEKIVPDILYAGLSYLTSLDPTIAAFENLEVLVLQQVPNYNANTSAAIEYRKIFSSIYPEEKMSIGSFEGFIVAKIVTQAMLFSNTNHENFLFKLQDLNDLYLGLNVPVNFNLDANSNSTGISNVWYTKIINKKFEYVKI